jgi:hypothetical protein
VALNTSAFSNALNSGTFSLSVTEFAGGSAGLFLNFTPVPEPSTWALLIAGLGAIGFVSLRRHRDVRL